MAVGKHCNCEILLPHYSLALNFANITNAESNFAYVTIQQNLVQ